MQLRVDYQDGRLEFEGDPDRVVAAWEGPDEPPSSSASLRDRLDLALGAPLDYPPLRQVVVPGDRVVIPFDPSVPEAEAILAAVAEILRGAGVGSITAVVDGRTASGTQPACAGVEFAVHDPTDRESLSYLATTEAGRRVYLNRLVTDADCVIPIGRIGYGPGGASLGPWTTIEPGLGDTAAAPVSLLASARPKADKPGEAGEIAWLLGCPFQVAAIPGRSGLLHVVAGEAGSVESRGIALLDATWSLDLADRSDLVIVGIGGPDRAGSPTALADGLRAALRVVRHGGKVAVLTRLGLDAIRDALLGPALPSGDWAKALAWADIYVSSAADPDALDDLGVIPLDRPDQAARLARLAPSLVTISQADRTRTRLLD